MVIAGFKLQEAINTTSPIDKLTSVTLGTPAESKVILIKEVSRPV
jgi:hypothetical protein